MNKFHVIQQVISGISGEVISELVIDFASEVPNEYPDDIVLFNGDHVRLVYKETD